MHTWSIEGSLNWDACKILRYGNIESSQNWDLRVTLRYVPQHPLEINNKRKNRAVQTIRLARSRSPNYYTGQAKAVS